MSIIIIIITQECSTKLVHGVIQFMGKWEAVRFDARNEKDWYTTQEQVCFTGIKAALEDSIHA